MPNDQHLPPQEPRAQPPVIHESGHGNGQSEDESHRPFKPSPHARDIPHLPCLRTHTNNLLESWNISSPRAGREQRANGARAQASDVERPMAVSPFPSPASPLASPHKNDAVSPLASPRQQGLIPPQSSYGVNPTADGQLGFVEERFFA